MGPGYSDLIAKAVAETRFEVLRESSASTTSVTAPPLDEATTLELSAYLSELSKWNERVNLTAARSPEELVDLTLADASMLAQCGAPGAWVDVGTGAGAPGLILAILRADRTLTLVEPRSKRVAFLRTVVGRSRASAQVIRARSEALAAGSFDFAVSRATLSPDAWLREGARLARRGTWVLLAQAGAPALPGQRIVMSVDYKWPLTGVSRRGLLFTSENCP